MLRIKSCPRCVGDMFLESSLDGPEWVCVQCGNRFEGRRREGARGSLQPLALAAGSRQPYDERERRFDQAMERDLHGACVHEAA